MGFRFANQSYTHLVRPQATWRQSSKCWRWVPAPSWGPSCSSIMAGCCCLLWSQSQSRCQPLPPWPRGPHFHANQRSDSGGSRRRGACARGGCLSHPMAFRFHLLIKPVLLCDPCLEPLEHLIWRGRGCQKDLSVWGSGSDKPPDSGMFLSPSGKDAGSLP